MSDFVTVNLQLREADFELFHALFDEYDDMTPGSAEDDLVELVFWSCHCANLGIESEMANLRIPYTKTWSAGDERTFGRGAEHLRVMSNGQVLLSVFPFIDEATLSLQETIEAYEKGNIEAFLARKQQENHVMSWDEQLQIMLLRDKARAHLKTKPVEAIDALLVDYGIDCDGTTVRDSKVESLLNSGYLPVGMTRQPEIKPSIHSPIAKVASFCLQSNNDTGDTGDTGAGDLHGSINSDNNLSLAVSFDGYSDFCSDDTNGTPIYFEKYNGELRVVVYGDINQEDPTAIVSLEGARCDKRLRD